MSKPKSTKNYDPRCRELASYFLDNDPTASEEEIDWLARHIQQAVEDFLAER